MHIFDRIDPTNLDSRELQLWLLSFVVIVVLSVATALLMYPTIFSAPVVVSGPLQRRAFISFCALAILLLGYLADRQLTILHLRKQLREEQQTLTRVRRDASTDLLATLPDFQAFQDRLAMEYRRAAAIEQPLSLVLVVLKFPLRVADPLESSAAFGDAAKAMMHKLRGEDSIYLFSPGVFCIVLPGVTAQNAYVIAGRLTEGLQDASGLNVRFSFRLQVFNYPEHAKSARQMEEAVRPFMPRYSAPPLEETKAVPTSSP